MSSLPDGWESDYDGSRWFFRYKPTGLVQYHFPQAGDEYSEYYGDFGDAAPDLAPEELLESERQLKRKSTTGERRSSRKQGTSREPIVEEEQDDSGGGGGLFSFESFAYLGPGSYNDVSPLGDGDEDDGRPNDAPARGGSGSAMLTPAGETPGAQSLSPMTSAGATPNVVKSEPVLAVDTGYVMAPGGYPQQQQQQMSPGVPMLDSTERPFELPDASNMGTSNSHALARAHQAYSPVGFMAELPSELTAACLEETNPPPIELPGSEIVFGGVQMGSFIQSGPVELPHEPIEVARIAKMPGLTAQQATTEGAKMIESTEAAQGAIAQGQGQHESSIRRKPTVTGAPLYRPFQATQIIAEEEVPGRPSSVLGNMSVAGSGNHELGKFNKRHSMAGVMPPPSIDRASVPLSLQPPNRPPKEPLGDHAAEALRPGPKGPDPRFRGTGTRDRSISTPAMPAHPVQGAQGSLQHVPPVLQPPQGPSIASQGALAPTTKGLAHVPSVLKPGRGQAPAVPIQAGQAAQDQRFKMPPKAYMAFAVGQQPTESSATGMSREPVQQGQLEPSGSRPSLLRHITLPEQMISQTKPLEGIVEPSAVPAPLSLGKKRPGAPSSVPMSANFASASLPPAETARRKARAKEAEKKEQQRSDSSEVAPMVVSIEIGAEAAPARSPSAQAQDMFPPLETRPPRMHSDSIVSDVSAPTSGSMSSGRLNSIQTPSPLQTPDASHRPSVVSLNSYQSDVAAARANVAPVGAYSQTRTHHSDSIVSDISAPTGSTTSSRLNSFAIPSPLQTPDVSEQPPAIEASPAQNAPPKTSSPPTSFGIIASEIVPPPTQATLAPPEPGNPQTSTSQGGDSSSSLGRSMSVVSAMSSNGLPRSQGSEQVSPVPSTVTPVPEPSSPQQALSSGSAEQGPQQVKRKVEPLGIVVEHSVAVEAENVTAPVTTGGSVVIEVSSEAVGVSTEPADEEAWRSQEDSVANTSGSTQTTQTQSTISVIPAQGSPLEQGAISIPPTNFSVQGQDLFTAAQHPTYTHTQAPQQPATPIPGQAASPPLQSQTMAPQAQLPSYGAPQGFQPPGTSAPSQVHSPPPQKQSTPVQQGQPFIIGPPQGAHHPGQVQSPPPQPQHAPLRGQQPMHGVPQRDQSATPVPSHTHALPSQSQTTVSAAMSPHPPPGAGPAGSPPSQHTDQVGYPGHVQSLGQWPAAAFTQQPHMRAISPSAPVQGAVPVINPLTAQVGSAPVPPAGSPRPAQPGYPGSPPNAPMNLQNPVGPPQRPPQNQFVPQTQGEAPNQSMLPQMPQGRMTAIPQAQQPFPAPQGTPRPATMPPQPSSTTQIAGRPVAQAPMPGIPQGLAQPTGQPGNATQIGGRPLQASDLAPVQIPVVAPGGMVMPPSFQNSPDLISRPSGVVSPPLQQGLPQVGMQRPVTMPPPVQPLQQQLRPQTYGQQQQQQQMRPNQGAPTIGPVAIQSPAVNPQAPRPPVMGGQQPIQHQHLPNQGAYTAHGSASTVQPMQPPNLITQQTSTHSGRVQQQPQQTPQGTMYGHIGPQPEHPGTVQQPQLSTQQARPQIGGRQAFVQPQMGPPSTPYQAMQGQQQPQAPIGQQVAAQHMPVQGQQQPQMPGQAPPSGAPGQTQSATQQAPGYVQQQAVYRPQNSQPLPPIQPSQPVQAPQQYQYPPNYGQPCSTNAAAHQQPYAVPGQIGKPPMTPLQTNAQVQGSSHSNSPASVHTQHERPPSIISVISTASSHGHASTAQSASPQRIQSMPQQSQMSPGIPPQGVPPQQYQPQMYPQMPGAQQMQPRAATPPGQFSQATQPNPGLPAVYSPQHYPQKPLSQQAGSSSTPGATATQSGTPQLHAGSIPSAQPAKKAWYKGWKRSGLKWTSTVGAGAAAAEPVGADASNGMTWAEGMYDARKEQNTTRQSEQENLSKLLGQPQPPSQPSDSQAGQPQQQQQQQQQSQQGVITQVGPQHPPQQHPGQQQSSQQSFGQQPGQQYPPQVPGQCMPQQQFGAQPAQQYNQQQVPGPMMQSAPSQMQGVTGPSMPSHHSSGHGPSQMYNTMPAPAQPAAPHGQMPPQQYQNQARPPGSAQRPVQPSSPIVPGQPGQYTNPQDAQQPLEQASPGMPSQHDLRPSGNYEIPNSNPQLFFQQQGSQPSMVQQQGYQPVNYHSLPVMPMQQQQQPCNPAPSTQHAGPVSIKYSTQDQGQPATPQGPPPPVQAGPQPGYQQPPPATPSGAAPSATGINQLPSQSQQSAQASSTGTASGNQAAGGKDGWGTGNYSGDGWGDNGW